VALSLTSTATITALGRATIVVAFGRTVITPAGSTAGVAIAPGYITIMAMACTLFGGPVCTALVLIGMAFHGGPVMRVNVAFYNRSVVRVNVTFYNRSVVGVNDCYRAVLISNDDAGNGAQKSTENGTFNSLIAV
jgi:hypothetical protein